MSVRSIRDLQKNALLHWPEEIIRLASLESSLHVLLKTQDDFISLLKLSNKNPFVWQDAIKASASLNETIFLKHLMVLSDIGGETLNKIVPISDYFPGNYMEFIWNDNKYRYCFKQIHLERSLTNSSLGVDSKGFAQLSLKNNAKLLDKTIDTSMLILYGAQGVDDKLPLEIKDKCIVGGLIGKPDDLDKFVRENYIRVSRQISGATANYQGQLAQDYVINKLRSAIPQNWVIERNSNMPDVHGVDNKLINFDIVVKTPTNKVFGVEVSFQVTTNSTIERKARESEALFHMVNKAKHKICYVIDGAGNINVRESAIEKICSNSDCTVAMSDSDLRVLAEFMLDNA